MNQVRLHQYKTVEIWNFQGLCHTLTPWNKRWSNTESPKVIRDANSMIAPPHASAGLAILSFVHTSLNMSKTWTFDLIKINPCWICSGTKTAEALIQPCDDMPLTLHKPVFLLFHGRSLELAKIHCNFLWRRKEACLLPSWCRFGCRSHWHGMEWRC